MAKFSALDHKITINGTNFSDHIAQVELSMDRDTNETTAFGLGWRTYETSLAKAQLKLDFHQDFAASSIDQTLWPLFNSSTARATVVITPTSGSVSSTNPSYTMTCIPSQYSPFASSVGDLATMSLTWPVDGTVTRGTS